MIMSCHFDLPAIREITNTKMKKALKTDNLQPYSIKKLHKQIKNVFQPSPLTSHSSNRNSKINPTWTKEYHWRKFLSPSDYAVDSFSSVVYKIRAMSFHFEYLS